MPDTNFHYNTNTLNKTNVLPVCLWFWHMDRGTCWQRGSLVCVYKRIRCWECTRCAQPCGFHHGTSAPPPWRTSLWRMYPTDSSTYYWTPSAWLETSPALRRSPVDKIWIKHEYLIKKKHFNGVWPDCKVQFQKLWSSPVCTHWTSKWTKGQGQGDNIVNLVMSFHKIINIPEQRKRCIIRPSWIFLKAILLYNNFSRRDALKKPCQILNLNSAKIVNASRRKMQKMDGWTESQADAEWWYKNLIYSTLNTVIWELSAQYVKERRRKVRKTVYFQYSKSQKGHYSYKNWYPLTTLEVDL